jgi:uncharacterized protein
MSTLGIPGGAMIGLAASILLIFNGDILGASGIASTAFVSPLTTFQDPQQHWKYVFLAAFLLLDTFVLERFHDRDFDNSKPLSNVAYGVAGLFVGLGTKLGNGCTSGHGICGLARLSKRSFVAVCTFMSWAMLTATVCYGIPAFQGLTDIFLVDGPWRDIWMPVSYALTGSLTLMALYAVIFHTSQSDFGMKKLIPAALAGL